MTGAKLPRRRQAWLAAPLCRLHLAQNNDVIHVFTFPEGMSLKKKTALYMPTPTIHTHTRTRTRSHTP